MWRHAYRIIGIMVGLLVGMGGTGFAKESSASIRFVGKTYILQNSVGNSREWLNEYLPAGEKFSSYSTMFTVRSYDALRNTPQEVASSVIYNLKANYPDTEYSFFPGKGDDAGLSFILAKPGILEFNFFRFTTYQGHPVALQFVYREYPTAENEDQVRQKMVQTIQKNATAWEKEMMSLPVPAIQRGAKKPAKAPAKTPIKKLKLVKK